MLQRKDTFFTVKIKTKIKTFGEPIFLTFFSAVTAEILPLLASVDLSI